MSRLRDRSDAHGVDARRKIVERSIPAERDRTAARNHLTRAFVNEEQLEFGMVGHQRPEVASGVVAVKVVLRPYAVKEVLSAD
jgi:hypothetical protein